MYGTLALSHRALDDLADAAGISALEELRALARPLEGLRVLNLSVTGFGTGTAELLNSSVPLLTDLGLDCHWQVVRGSEDVAAASRAMYQALGGTYIAWTQEMSDSWLRYASLNADLLTEPFDVIVVHDPQPAAIRSFVPDEQKARWVYHSHLDLSSAQEEVWGLVRSHVEQYDAVIWDSPSFAAETGVREHIVAPAIDPNSARNMPLPDDVIETVMQRYGLDPHRPLISQISPCDAESDLVGAVDMVCELRKRIPDVQLAIVLTTEPVDSVGRGCYDDIVRRCQDESGIVIISTRDFGNVEFNVLQRAATVVIQRGLRKGFGMWVSDALWKERPVVVGGAPGLREQVADGETGIVAGSPAQFGEAVARLLEDPEFAAQLGRNGRKRVAERFLITRYLRDYLHILTELHRSN